MFWQIYDTNFVVSVCKRSVQETLNVAFDEFAMKKTRTYEWCEDFQNSYDTPWQPSTLAIDGNKENVKKMNRVIRQSPVRGISDDAGLSIGPYQVICVVGPNV